MDKKKYKKITGKKNVENMRIWELIFFMFFEDYVTSIAKKTSPRKFETQVDILDAVQAHYGASSSERLSKLSQGGISKGLGVLYSPIEYMGTLYIIRKIADREGADEHKTYQIKTFNIDTKEDTWRKEHSNLLSKNLLVSNQMCQVSRYMYVFKINPPKIQIKKELAAKMTPEDVKMLRKNLKKEGIKKNGKRAKKYFENMIDPATLFDVSLSGEKITVMLNKTEEVSLYVRLFEKFFVYNSEPLGS